MSEIENHFNHCIESLKAYITDRRPLGGFLEAVVSNDLKESALRADVINQNLLFDYIGWLYNNAPIGSWGSPENYENWLNKEAGHERD